MVRYFQFDSISFVFWITVFHLYCKATQPSTALNLYLSIARPTAAEVLLARAVAC